MNHLPWLLGALRRASDGELQTLESSSSQRFDWESNSCLRLLIATRLHAYTKVQWTFRVGVSYVALSRNRINVGERDPVYEPESFSRPGDFNSRGHGSSGVDPLHRGIA